MPGRTHFARKLPVLPECPMPEWSPLQRVLSSDTAHHAKLLSFFAAAGCIIMSIPPIMIGAIARSTDWTETNFFEQKQYNPEECGETDKILPIVLATLTPPVVSTIGMCS